MRGDLLLSWVNYSMVGGVNHIFEKGYFYRKFLKRPAQQIFLPGPKFSEMATVFWPPAPYRRCPPNGFRPGPFTHSVPAEWSNSRLNSSPE